MAQIASTEPPGARSPLRTARPCGWRSRAPSVGPSGGRCCWWPRCCCSCSSPSCCRSGSCSIAPPGTRASRTTCRASAPGSRRTRPEPSPTRPPTPHSSPISWPPSENRTAGVVGTRINYDLPGTRSLFTAAARKADKIEPPFREAMIELDDDWADPELWAVMRAAASAHTPNFYVAALDRKLDETGSIVRVPPNERVYVPLFWRTLLDLGADRGDLPAARLSGGASPRHPAAGALEPADGPGAAAVLDLAPGAHHELDRAAAEPGRDQQRARLHGHRLGWRTASR